MKRARFTKDRIIGVLKRRRRVPRRAIWPGGTACRKRRSTTGGLEVCEARRLRELENENAKLKRLLADTMLDNVALKDLLIKKW